MKKAHQKASLKISQDVVETISKVAALEVEGVAGIVAADSTMFPFKKKAIEIALSDGVAEITLHIVLKFGAKIATTCESVQQSVKENIQTMTGIMVSRVNIFVDNIETPNSKL